MFRRTTTPRNDWPKIVESQGMHYHTADEVPYWDEGVYYEFTAAEIDVLEEATYELDKMCLTAVQHVIDEERFDPFLIPQEFRAVPSRLLETRRDDPLWPLRPGL